MAITEAELWQGLEATCVPLLDVEQCPGWTHDGQREVWASDALEVVTCSGTQGGKTALDAPWLLRQIARTAKYYNQIGEGDEESPMSQANYIVMGPELELLRRQAIPYIEDLLERKHKLGVMKGATSGRPSFVFSEYGARRLVGAPIPITIHFLSGEDPQAAESITALGGLWDEGGQQKNKQATYRAFNRRLGAARTLGAKLGVKALGARLWTTTPYVHNWFKRRVVDPAMRGEDGYSYHSWASWVNPGGISKAEAEKQLANGMDLADYQMMYEGKWPRPMGAIFPGFTKDRNTINRRNLPPEINQWPIYVGLDFGTRNLAAVICKLSPAGRLYAYATYFGSGEDCSIHVERIKAKAGGPIEGAFGGSLGERTWRQDFADEGLEVGVPQPTGPDSVAGRIQRHKRAINRGDFVIVDDLDALIKEHEDYSYEVDDEGRVNQNVIVDKRHFHRLDASGYLSGTILGGGEIEISSRRVDDEDDDMDEFWGMKKEWANA